MAIPDMTKKRNQVSTLDLHGYTLHDAWKVFDNFIEEEAQNRDRKYSIVITGNGIIKEELPRWCDKYSFVREVSQLERGAGFCIYFYRER